MKILCVSLLTLLAFSHPTFAQAPARWEHLGPVTFSSIVLQSPTVLVMTTTDGWLYVSSDYGATWKHRYIDDTLSLIDAKFVDSLHGVLAAVDGTVLFTSDGGATWSRSHIADGGLVRVAYPSRDTAYVCALGGVWQTTDRGGSWTLHVVTGSQTVNAIYFFDDNTGFAVGNAGLFAKTTDAGLHWATQDIGAGDSIDLECMDFYGRDTGVVAGAGYTYATTDGGARWRRSGLLPTGYNKPTAIKLTSGHQFFGFSDGIDEFSSTDLGVSFRPLQQTFGSGESTINGVCSVSGHGVIIAGGDGEVQRSTDAGMNWKPLNLCISKENLISVGDSMLCGVGGYAGNMFYSSTNGGQSWFSHQFYNQHWRGLWFDSPNDGVAINESGNLSAVTTDGGHTWSNDVPWSDTGVTGIPILGIGEFVGHGDTAYFYSNDSIFTTINHGKTWKTSHIADPDTTSPYPGVPASTIYKPSLSSFYCLNRDHWYLSFHCFDGLGTWNLKYHERYYQTQDAGQTWQMIKSAPFKDVGTIYYQNPAVGFICGDHGELSRTSDGGATWNYQVLTGDHGISAVNFLNDTLGFCAANDASSGEGQVFITTNGGLTWRDDSLRSQINGKRPWITGIIFPDSNTVMLLAHEGFFRRHLTAAPLASVKFSPFGNKEQYLDIQSYPNPASATLRCQAGGIGEAPAMVTILDVLGRTVTSIAIANASDFSLDTRQLPSGVYTIIVKSGGQAARGQFVIAR